MDHVLEPLSSSRPCCAVSSSNWILSCYFNSFIKLFLITLILIRKLPCYFHFFCKMFSVILISFFFFFFLQNWFLVLYPEFIYETCPTKSLANFSVNKFFYKTCPAILFSNSNFHFWPPIHTFNVAFAISLSNSDLDLLYLFLT